MRIGWVGFHVEGIPALHGILERGYRPEAVITLKPDQAAKRSGAADYRPTCREFGIPLHEVANINDDEGLALLDALSLDIVFVIGWTQIVGSAALRRARLGMIGTHASLLPANRGRAPINWALIKGEQRTGNSLIWLAEGVDTGDIIDQTVIPITPYDNCATLYEKVGESNREMILRALPKLVAGQRPGQPQPRTNEPDLPGRRPRDGLVNWSQSSRDTYNFIRALTRPYPGAFSWLDQTRWFIWHCALLAPGAFPGAPPGRCMGPVFSPAADACGQIVACGKGAVLLLEIEKEDGAILKGRALSDQSWEGRNWSNEEGSGSSGPPG
jgi:methionyl-tRNA formyltransferase